MFVDYCRVQYQTIWAQNERWLTWDNMYNAEAAMIMPLEKLAVSFNFFLNLQSESCVIIAFILGVLSVSRRYTGASC